MTNHAANHLTPAKRILLAAAAIGAIIGPIVIGVVNAPPIRAQSQPAKPPEFEVASVKRVAARGGPGDIPRNMDDSPGHLVMRNVPLRYCLEWAYDLKDYQISGPDWLRGEEQYDIIANASGPASNEQMKPMLQALLTERFQMKLHRETRSLSVYALIPGKAPRRSSRHRPIALQVFPAARQACCSTINRSRG